MNVQKFIFCLIVGTFVLRSGSISEYLNIGILKMLRGLDMGEIIPFTVWIIPFSVSKINFETIGTYEKHFEKEVF